MDRISIKSGFTLFNKKKENLQNTSNNINQNALWVQSLEPIKYAKICSGNLYKIDDFKTETNDLALSKKELFSNLKNQLDEKNDLIKKIFLGTSDGSLNVGLNSILIDSMLRVVFKKIYHKIFNNTDYIFSIIAVGGYGRGELAPCSDLDLLFLLPNNLKINESKHAEEVIQFILYILWDLGYSVGHSTRTIDDCIEKSKLDLTISTALLEKRFIVGNEDVFSLLNDKFTLFIKNTKTLKFVEAKLVESELRHKRFGGSRYVVEPNVKDGKGGLRDLHTLIWISKFAYKVDSVSKLINMGALSKKEAASWLEKILLSAIANWEYKVGGGENADDYDLYIKTAFSDDGTMLKRFRPAPHGRAHRIRKRTCHITLIVENRIPSDADKAPVEEEVAEETE